MKKRLTILAILVFGLLLANSALAIMMPVGAAWDGNSWSHKFVQYGAPDFDTIEIHAVPMSFIFEEAAMSVFSDSSWAVQNTAYNGSNSTAFAQASGDLITSATPVENPPTLAEVFPDLFVETHGALYFNVKFYGDITTDVSFDFVAWNITDTTDPMNPILVEATTLEWTNGYDGCTDCWDWWDSTTDYNTPIGWDSSTGEIRPVGGGNGSPVPEPATLLLLGTGLVGLAGFRRKLKK